MSTLQIPHFVWQEETGNCCLSIQNIDYFRRVSDQIRCCFGVPMARLIRNALFGSRSEHGHLTEYERLYLYSRHPDLKKHEFLPTYETATATRRWDLIAPYVRNTDDLVRLCIVSKEFHRIFTPFLWGSPALHFGPSSASQYRALGHFFRCCEQASILTRINVHTLDLSQLHSYSRSVECLEYWLPLLFDRLPTLQVVKVDQMKARQNRPAMSLLHLSPPSILPPLPYLPNRRFGLRMLVLNDVRDISETMLQEALKQFPNLIYLDLSGTPAASSATLVKVVSREQYFPNLGVLKLARVSLCNPTFFSLLIGLSPRLWSLDVRHNYLEDSEFLEATILHAFVKPFYPPPSYYSAPGLRPRTMDPLLEMLPLNDRARHSHVDHRIHNVLDVDSEEYVSGVLGSHPIRNVGPQVENGLTHLYVSGNQFSSKSIDMFLQTARLRVFDVGTVLTPVAIRRGWAWNDEHFPWYPTSPGIWWQFNARTRGSLHSFRLNHHFITLDAESLDDGTTPGSAESAQLLGFPKYVTEVVNLDPDEHVLQFRLAIAELAGLRVLVLSDVPSKSHRGWITRILADFVDTLGKVETTIEHLYLELTAAGEGYAPNKEPQYEGPSHRKLPGGGRLEIGGPDHHHLENPWAGSTKDVLEDYLATHQKWKGKVHFLCPPRIAWGPSSQKRDQKQAAAQDDDTGSEMGKSSSTTTTAEGPGEHQSKKRWFHFPWTRTEGPEGPDADGA